MALRGDTRIWGACLLAELRWYCLRCPAKTPTHGKGTYEGHAQFWFVRGRRHLYGQEVENSRMHIKCGDKLLLVFAKCIEPLSFERRQFHVEQRLSALRLARPRGEGRPAVRGSTDDGGGEEKENNERGTIFARDGRTNAGRDRRRTRSGCSSAPRPVGGSRRADRPSS